MCVRRVRCTLNGVLRVENDDEADIGATTATALFTHRIFLLFT